MYEAKNIVIIGGGFAAISCVQELEELGLDRKHHITLISNKQHFEYHAALYRLVAGGSHQETCIPLTTLIRSKNIHIKHDHIEKIDPLKKLCHAKSGKSFPYDYLVIAIGSKTSYKDIPGLEKNAFSFKSFAEANELKKHLHQVFEEASKYTTLMAQETASHITVVGGGASGVEIAAELSSYIKTIAKNHNVSLNQARVSLIHSRSRLLSELPAKFSKKIENRLKNIGVKLILDHRVVKEDFNTIFLDEASIQSKTLIWTAGVTLPTALATVVLSKNPDGSIVINDYLQTPEHQTIFIAGDNTKTRYSGMAQTALAHGKLIGKNINQHLQQKPLIKNHDREPIYAIPLGKNWAAVKIKNLYFYGFSGWIIRRLLDLKVFMSLLPMLPALGCFMGGYKHLESCPDCC